MARRLALHRTLLLTVSLLFSFTELRAQNTAPAPVSPSEQGSRLASPRTRVIDPRLRQRAPKMKSQIRVQYPPNQACFGIAGNTVLIVSVAPDGNVKNVIVDSSSNDRALDQAAVVAARNTRWSPEIFNGNPTACKVRVPINFVLSPPQPEYCHHIDVALVDANGVALQVTPPAPGQLLHVQLGLYVPSQLEFEAVLQRIDTDKRRNAPDRYLTVHKEHRILEPPTTADKTVVDLVSSQPMAAGIYRLETRINGVLRNTAVIEVR